MNKLLIIGGIAAALLLIIIVVMMVSGGATDSSGSTKSWVRDTPGVSYVSGEIPRDDMEVGSPDGNIVYLGRADTADKCESLANSGPYKAWSWIKIGGGWTNACYGVVNPIQTKDNENHRSGYLA